MAYELQAILGRQAALERHRDRYRNAHVVPLNLGWAIIPLTFALRRELGRARTPGVWDASAVDEDFQRAMTAWLEEISRDDVVAYVAADMSPAYPDYGSQDAGVWRDGQMVLGPLHSRGQGAINQVLRFMGVPVDPAAREGDEFDTLGLGRHRKTEQWVEAAEALRGVAPRREVWRWVEGARPAGANPRPAAVRRLLALLARTAGRGTRAVSQQRAVERDGDWVLPVTGCTLTHCGLAHAAFSMHFNKPGVTVDVSIEGPTILHRPAHADVLLDPSADEEQLRPAFGLLGLTVKGAMAYATGRLEVHFADGSRLSVDPREDSEAWRVDSSRGLRMVATPGGGLAVWRERSGDGT